MLFIDIMSISNGGNNIYTEILAISVIIILLFFSIIVIFAVVRRVDPAEYESFEIIEATQEKGITSEFLLSYVLPLFVFDFTMWKGMFLFIVYYSVLAFLCIRNNNVYANLLFEAKNNRFYACVLKSKSEDKSHQIEVLAISKANLCAKRGNTIRATSLDKPFFIVEQ